MSKLRSPPAAHTLGPCAAHATKQKANAGRLRITIVAIRRRSANVARFPWLAGCAMEVRSAAHGLLTDAAVTPPTHPRQDGQRMKHADETS
jgi:hypothetical protein